MGDRYHWYEPCPDCGERMLIYYAESCDSTDAQCPSCKKEYDIVMTFKLKPKKENEQGTRISDPE